MNIKQLLDNLMQKLKENPEFNSIIFTKANTNNKVPRPLLNNLCTIGLKEFDSIINDNSKTKIKLNLYVPLEYGGEKCAELAGNISVFIFENINNISNIKISETSYNQYTVSFECVMTITLKTNLLCTNFEKEINTTFTDSFKINGKEFFGTEITLKSTYTHEKYYQIWDKKDIYTREENLNIITINELPESTLNYILALNDKFTFYYNGKTFENCQIKSYDISKNICKNINIIIGGI